MVEDDSWKNPALISFFKLLLGDVKVDILWIFWAFFGGFLDAPPPPPNHWRPHFFGNERCWGGTYIRQVSFKSGLWFLSFQFANIFVAAESRHNNTPNPSLFLLKNKDILERVPLATIQILLKLFISLQCEDSKLLCQFFAQAIYLLDKTNQWNFKF